MRNSYTKILFPTLIENTSCLKLDCSTGKQDKNWGGEYSKTATLKKTEIVFQDQLCLMQVTAGQKYCRMLQGEHSAILSTFIKLPFVIKRTLFCLFLSGRFTHRAGKIH